MSENKLFNIVSSTSGVEKRAFSDYLRSPYFNRREDVNRLWQLVQRSSDAFPPAAEGFAHVYPGEPFDAARWRHVQSFLTAQLEAFLAQRAYEHLPLERDLLLAPVYREKQLEKPLHYLLQRAGERLAKLPRDHAFFQLQYRLEWERYAAVESHSRGRDNNLAAVSRALDLYYVGAKLRLACLMESHRAVFNVDYDTAYLPAALQWLEENDGLQEPVIALYYHCYRALSGGDEPAFRAFRQHFESHGATLPPDERRTFLLLAVNYCIRRLNEGNPRFVRETFDLYRLGLEAGVLLENGYLGRFAYKNIVALALRLDAFEWVEQFIRDYEPHIEEKYRAAYRDYNLARLYFARRDYRRAMPLLAQVDESDLLLNLDSRIMLLKMYYETGEWDALDALIASFRILLLRKKRVIGYHQTHYLNTLRYMGKLTRLNLNDKAAAAVFRQEVERNNAVLEREWLLAQVPSRGGG